MHGVWNEAQRMPRPQADLARGINILRGENDRPAAVAGVKPKQKHKQKNNPKSLWHTAMCLPACL